MAQGTLGAADVRRIWAGAGPQHAAYRGGGHMVRSHAQLVDIIIIIITVARPTVSQQ